MKTPNITKPIALITGANRGLGLQTAQNLAAKGMLVLLAARQKSAAEEAAKGLVAQGFDVRPLALDVTRRESVQAARAWVDQEFGRLDVLVNNAGIFKEGAWFQNTSATVSEEILRETFETNFFGLVLVTQEFLPLIKKSEAGRIVNVSSIIGSLALQSDPSSFIAPAKVFAYSASKAAVNAFTIHLAAALRDTNIKVNSAHPGWVRTELGTSAATMSVEEGVVTAVDLATLGDEGPTGGFIHARQTLAW